MLINLHVKNLALLREVDVDFGNGLNILTGETGAGKSLIIGSINIALGQKISKELVDETKESMVQLVFELSENCSDELKKMGVSSEDNQIIITRKTVSGRTISKINDETVTLSELKKVMSLLIDVHGQHEHQSLLYKSNHLKIIDEFGKNEIAELKNQVGDIYRKYCDIKERLNEYNIDDSDRIRKMDLMRFEIDEIENAALTEGEDEELEKMFKKLLNANKLIESLSQIYEEIGYNNGCAELLSRASKSILSVSDYDEKVSDFNSRVQELDMLTRDLLRDISDYIEELNFDFARFDEVSNRLDLINHLKIKYNKSIKDILKYADEQRELLNNMENYHQKREELKKIYDDAYMELEKACNKLSELRKKKAEVLAEKIRESLIDLNFLNVEFDINFTKKEMCSANGNDEAEFLISTNPGEKKRPLAQIASGGELSRIMLAIKTILAESDMIDTLIFDEIDTGISGRTAQAVAEKLNLIAQNHQVICITHSPQIAAMADMHMMIEKRVCGGKTETIITNLNNDDSIRELARILGGAELTDMTFAHAKEMKDLADKTKKY